MPRRCASSRRAMLWSREPVKCWRTLPKHSGATTRRSKRRPSWPTTVAFVSPRAATSDTHVPVQNASISVAGSPEVAIRSRSRTVSRRRRTLPASETAIASGRADELVDDASHRRQRLSEEVPTLRFLADSGLERAEDLLLAPGAQAREIAQPALLRSRLQALERRDPELRPDPRGRLRTDARKPQEVDHPGRHEPAPLREGVHLAVLDDLDDLLLDRLPDPGQLLRLPVEGELRDGHGRLADPAGGAPVGDHLERVLGEDLREIREKVELVGKLAVPRQRPDHPAMIRTCLARSSASRPTTSARIWSR